MTEEKKIPSIVIMKKNVVIAFNYAHDISSINKLNNWLIQYEIAAASPHSSQ